MVGASELEMDGDKGDDGFKRENCGRGQMLFLMKKDPLVSRYHFLAYLLQRN